ncbi:helix-turn-helix domain-containing protein [Flavobacterium sp. FBOR7N2.3]|uniref:Helix-turn-helix domain-containing protein n=1 Tax=Flavobacterium magnesitis TaxID=3138077 RepID=A0ABV4TMQ7_9FLAO
MENQNLAQGVKELRKRKALSQDELAKSAGLSLRTVQRVENGETIPTGETLKRIAAVLEVVPDELLGFTSEKEVPKIVLKTKHEYIHFFKDKLVFSKTPEINLVDDYRKSVTYVFKTLMVFFIIIPISAIFAIVFYNMQRMDLVLYSGSFGFAFLIMAIHTMFFSSGTPLININTITKIKFRKFFQNNIVEIYFVESGRVKGKGLVLEKNQIDAVMNCLQSDHLIEEKDINNNKRGTIFFLIIVMSPQLLNVLCSRFISNSKGAMYSWGIYFIFLSLFLIIKMIRNRRIPVNRNKHKAIIEIDNN